MSAEVEEAIIADIREAFGADGYPAAEAITGRPLDASGLITGSCLGDYVIVRAIGSGGMGIVYRARQLSLDRDVALKVLPAVARYHRSAVQRFQNEARAVARLKHPNVVPVFAHGEHEGYLYYAMELVDGPSLDTAIHSRCGLLATSSINEYSLVAAGRSAPGYADSGQSALSQSAELPPETAITPPQRSSEDFRGMARLLAEVADALAHAHDHGVIHRDIKPQNLLMGSDGRLRITDFGLAQLTDKPHVTVSGELMGTPAYLSPEQARGDFKRIDHRTDIYSMGATLYEMLTTRRPFEAGTRDQLLTCICRDEPKQPRRLAAEVPVDLETICLQAMDKDPEQRHASAAALAADLRSFSEGKPILSRRAGMPRRTFNWLTRRKGSVLMAVVSVVAVLFATGLWTTKAASRRRDAEQVLQRAYDHLAFRDYRSPSFVAADIERARSLPAEPQFLNLVEALASLGAADQQRAIEHLTALLQQEPKNVQALYILAWAQWRDHQTQASRATFECAEESGGPITSTDWFFRGLAVHFDRPEAAIESYRKANALQVQSGQFYPQALLHLARAYNQQMYVTRRLDSFPHAQGALQQLVEHQHYGAYSYYLLSIAHRLAGEINQANDDPTAAEAHFAEALSWAREGQLADASDDRTVTAEAECLERLGLIDEAIEARTRAIELAETELERCEQYHYRWRLFYWADDLDAALQDITAHAACIPNSRFYAHVYPALVYAEMGEMSDAVAEALSMSEEAPEDAQAVLWSATCLRLLGHAEQADLLLAAHAEDVQFSDDLQPPQTEQWVSALYEFTSDRLPLDELLSLSTRADPSRRLRAEAFYHAGVKALALGERDQALDFFKKAHQSFDGALGYSFHAKILVVNMQDDRQWPGWDLYPGS